MTMTLDSGRGPSAPHAIAQQEPRWLVRRRAEAAAATVMAQAMPVEDACRCYGVTLAQFAARQRAAARYIGGAVPQSPRFRLFNSPWR